MISPAVSSSFRERLIVMGLRDRTAADVYKRQFLNGFHPLFCVIGKLDFIGQPLSALGHSGFKPVSYPHLFTGPGFFGGFCFASFSRACSSFSPWDSIRSFAAAACSCWLFLRNLDFGTCLLYTSYEGFMKEKSYFKGVPPSLPPKGSRCEGCPYWRGIGCVFCYREQLKPPGIGR